MFIYLQLLNSIFSTKDHAKPPVILNPSNPNELFIGDTAYLYKFSNVRFSDDYNTILYVPDTSSGYLHSDINEIAICEANDSVIFVSTPIYWPSWVPQYYNNSIFKSTNSGETWMDITSNLSKALKFEPITGIAINPWDEDEIWTCFGNTAHHTHADSAKKVYHSTNGGQTWTAMAEGLHPEIPANEIVFDKKSGLLYLATDVGVYYYDTSEEVWYNMVSNVPTTYNLHIRFNHALSKIKVGTHGRGIWQTDIPCNTSTVNQVISSDTTWGTPQHIYSNVEIDSAMTLTITNEVFMAGGKQIIVKKGGHLLINGGTITNGCGGLWYGVMVLGDPSAPPTELNQGYVEITNGGTIENSQMGVFAYKMKMDESKGWMYESGHEGGIIQASNANFLNNITAVQFKDYSSNSTSFFSACTFETNNAYMGMEHPDYFMEVRGMDNIDIINCDFINKNDSLYMHSGIYCYNSDINLDGTCTGKDCIWDYGLFKNLEYGIYALATSSSIDLDIRHTEFTNNFRGVELSAITNARVTSNEFNINESYVEDGGCGLYLDECTGYWVEENVFEHDGDTITGLGILVNNSGGDANEIYRNDLINIELGIEAQKQNKGRTAGLQLLCNDFDDCDADIFVAETLFSGMGIAIDQGVEGSDDPEDMAGNEFYYETTTTDYDDINNEADGLDYFYDDPSDYDVKPDDSYGITDKTEDTNPTWSPTNGCPSEITTGGGIGTKSIGITGSYKEQLFYYSELAASTEIILQNMIDGGNTEQLNAEVELSTPPETMAIYNELIGESPFVSETVVETSIEKEEVLPNSLLRDIMVANPHTANSELMDKLDERAVVMPDYMKAQILQGKTLTTLKMELESQLADYKSKQSKALNRLVREYLADSINPESSQDSIIAIFQLVNDKNIQYRLAMMYLTRNEYNLSEDVLDDILVDNDLTGQELASYNKFVEYFDIVKEMKQAGRDDTDITEMEEMQLNNIINADAGFASAYARNLLLNANKLTYFAPVQLPDLTKSHKEQEELLDIMKTKPPKQLEVFPNPAKDFLIVHYSLELEKRGIIEIRDMTGKLLQEMITSEIENQVTLNTRQMETGTYVATLKIDGKTIESCKFTLVK